MNQRWGENDDYFMYSPRHVHRGRPLAGEPQGQGRGLRSAGAGPHPLYLRAAQHGPGPYVPRIVDEYKKEFGHEPIEDYP